MIITLHYPPYFTLIHKKSGKKFNTFGVTFISYEDSKFDRIDKSTKKPYQNKLI